MLKHLLFLLTLISVSLDIILSHSDISSQLENNFKKRSLDDAISHTDYLITIYSSSTSKPCLYFAENRFSQPDLSLINCTWYKANSCCKRTEVASVFLTMYTLYKASQTCMNMMNYMMCYFCSPDQYVWYRGTQVLICNNFCEEVYENCKMAEFGEKRIGDIYKDGRAFCEAQDFRISETNHQCFDFDPTPFSHSWSAKYNCFLSGVLPFISLLFGALF